VVLNAFSEGALADAAEQCKAAGAPEVLTIAADVSKKESVDAMIAKVVAEMGSLDIMVNNAGKHTRSCLLRCCAPLQDGMAR
jgi:NAD(P)-dependent dehydrogenase (short-subunit alcohol dehydrogenase family)